MAGRAGPETKLIARMRKVALDLYGERLAVFKHHGGPYAQAGVADIIGVIDGVAIACEVKSPETYGGNVEKALREGPTAKQREFAARWNEAGGLAWFAATVDQFLAGLEAAVMRTHGEEIELPPLVSGNQD